jgi:RNA polymerase sigma-70 factor (ECF subfamily)
MLRSGARHDECRRCAGREPLSMSEADSMSDAELVARANRGDAAAMSALYERHRAWSLSVATRFAGDAASGEDAVHDAFAYFFNKFPGFKLHARLTTFLYPVLKNCALTQRRKRIGLIADNATLQLLPATSPEGVDETTAAALHRAVSALPEAQREVLVMRVIDGMSPDEIALALAIPAGTAKSRLHHALAVLAADPTLRALVQ